MLRVERQEVSRQSLYFHEETTAGRMGRGNKEMRLLSTQGRQCRLQMTTVRIQPGTAVLPPGELGLQCEVKAPWMQGLVVASRRWAQPAGAMERTLQWWPCMGQGL